MHLAKSGRVIVKLSSSIKEGQILCDDKSGKVAKVMEMIGPVAQPYASATPLTDNITKYTGRKVFALLSKTPATKNRKKKLRRKIR